MAPVRSLWYHQRAFPDGHFVKAPLGRYPDRRDGRDELITAKGGRRNVKMYTSDKHKDSLSSSQFFKLFSLTGPIKIALYIDNDSSYSDYYIEINLLRYGGFGGAFWE